jgi:hypothetical protein
LKQNEGKTATIHSRFEVKQKIRKGKKRTNKYKSEMQRKEKYEYRSETKWKRYQSVKKSQRSKKRENIYAVFCLEVKQKIGSELI